MPIYYGDSSGKAQKIALTGIPGPQGPAGPQGVPGPQGPAGQGVPTGGTAGQVLTKKTVSDYDAEWKTVPSKRTCRFVVGTSTAGWTEADCDYLCDGTADDVEINAAIADIWAKGYGGEVVILSGTYKITKPIFVHNSHITLRGNGMSTVLQRNFNGTQGSDAVISYTYSSKDFIIRDLCVDGNKSSYNYRLNTGIYIAGIDGVHGGLIKNVLAFNNQDTGIEVIGKSNIVIDSCICHNNGASGGANYSGIYVYECNHITIASCICYNNYYSGIYVSGKSTRGLIANNICYGNQNGILISNSQGGSIVGNFCADNEIGIYLMGIGKSVISGNTFIRGTGLPSDYSSSQYTIRTYADTQKNLIVGNNIMGKNYVDNGTGNTWANNKYQ